MRNIILCTFILCLLASLFGDWGQIEVNKLAIITAYGLDKSDEGTFHLSVQVVHPQVGGPMQGGNDIGSSGESLVYSANGVNMADALDRLEKRISRKLFWGQADILVIGEKLASEGFQEELDFLVREDEMRLSILPFISKGKAVDILKATPRLAPTSADALEAESDFLLKKTTTLNDLIQMIEGEARAGMLPLIDTISSGRAPYIVGKAFLKGDQLVGVTGFEVSKGVMYITDTVAPSFITIQLDEGPVTLNIVHSNTDIVPSVQNGVWSMRVIIEVQDDIVQNSTTLDPSNPEVTNLISKEAERTIKRYAEEALKQVQQEMEVDAFNFGKIFHRHYPRLWKQEKEQWNKRYPEVAVQVEVNVDVLRPGLNLAPAGVPEDEVEE